MNNLIERKWCTKGTVYIEDLTGTAFTGEDGGHTFVISGVNPDGTSVTLAGTVAGAYILPDGSTQPLTGSIADGKAQITLDPECYALPGRGQLTIFLTASGQKVAIYGAVLNVARSSTDQVPPAITADVADLVNDIEEARATIPATYTDLMASLAKNYADLTYPVAAGTYAWQDGWMYRAKVDIPAAESWTAAHWEKVPLADSLVAEVSQLKGAIDNKAPAIIADTGLSHSFSAEEMQEAVDFSVIIHPNISTSMDVMLGQDIIPALDAYSGGCFYKDKGNKVIVNGTPSANSTYYGRVDTKTHFTPNVSISSGDTVYIRYYLSGSVTALQGGTEPGRVGLVLYYKNGTSKTQYYGVGVTRTGLFGNSVTASDDVESIGFEFLARTGYTYTDYTLYVVASKASSTKYSDLADDLVLTKEQTGTNGISFIPNDGYMHYKANTKTYIDNNIPDDVITEEKLVYLSPEMYGAKGDEVTDDSSAIQNCINDAITFGLPVRGFGVYAINSTITVNSSNANIFIHKLIYSGSGAAITLIGNSNYIHITGINAVNGCAFKITTSGNATSYNEIHIDYINAGLNAIEIYQEQSESSNAIYFNRFYLGRITSSTGNAVYLDCYRFAENILYGNSVSCVNGWAVYTNKTGGTRNTIVGFSMEQSCKNGVYGNFFIQNCRTIECMDQKRPDNNSGIIVKARGTPTTVKWDDSTYVDYDAVDVSECRTYDECIAIVKESYEAGNTKALSFDDGFGYYHDNYMGHAYRLGIYHNMPNNDGGGFPKRGHIIAYFNHKGFVPENGWYVQVNSATYTPFVTEAAFPTEFDLATNCTINLEDSYCCVGINEVIIHQYANAKAIVYDKNSNLIFDGTSLDPGTYKLSCIMVPHAITISTSRGEIQYTKSSIYFGMNDKWMVEKLNIIS